MDQAMGEQWQPSAVRPEPGLSFLTVAASAQGQISCQAHGLSLLNLIYSCAVAHRETVGIVTSIRHALVGLQRQQAELERLSSPPVGCSASGIELQVDELSVTTHSLRQSFSLLDHHPQPRQLPTCFKPRAITPPPTRDAPRQQYHITTGCRHPVLQGTNLGNENGDSSASKRKLRKEISL
jgi:hypothetical protein